MSEDKPLHVRVAEALGWTYVGLGEVGWEGEPPSWDWRAKIPRRIDQHIGIPRYETWTEIGPLIEKYGIELGIETDLPHRLWSATRPMDNYIPCKLDGSPLIAVCNLLLVLKEAGKL